MKFFKTQEEKTKELQNELEELQKKFSRQINTYCKIGDFIFIFVGFKIRDNRIQVIFIDKNTLPDHNSMMDLYWFGQKYGHSDFERARIDMLRFKDDLKKINLTLDIDKP